MLRGNFCTKVTPASEVWPFQSRAECLDETCFSPQCGGDSEARALEGPLCTHRAVTTPTLNGDGLIQTPPTPSFPAIHTRNTTPGSDMRGRERHAELCPRHLCYTNLCEWEKLGTLTPPSPSHHSQPHRPQQRKRASCRTHDTQKDLSPRHKGNTSPAFSGVSRTSG